MKPIAIIGVGNFLMGDEGIGIHAAKFLRVLNWPENTEVIDAGVPTLSLLHMVEGRRLVIIIDCADFGGFPGEIKAFRPDDVVSKDCEKEVSLHATNLLTTFDIAAQIGTQLPEIFIVGIQPSRIEMNTKLSYQTEEALKKLPAIIHDIIAKHGVSSLH